MKRNNKSETWVLCVALALTAVLYAVMIAFDLPCPIKYISGISCAGCGMTRALLSALRCDLAAAFAYHPLWIAVPMVAALLLVAHFKRWNKVFDVTIAVAACLFLIVWIIRLIDPACDVVSVDFSQSVFSRITSGVI